MNAAAAEFDTQPTTTDVLLVEDDRMFGELLERELEVHGDMNVLGVAATGEEAVALVAESQPHVIVLDYRLPDADGVTLAARLRDCVPEAALVMLTGHGSDDVVRAALGAGCSGFVTKDQAVDELVNAIRAVRDGKVALDRDRVAGLAVTSGGPRRGPHALTARERQVLRLLADGVTTRQIASRLFISMNTARNHVQRVINKLGAHSQLEAVAIARRDGVLSEG